MSMYQRVKIQVTESHIRRGDRCSQQNCMVAKAIKSQLKLPPKAYIRVTEGGFALYGEDYLSLAFGMFNKKVGEKICRFDDVEVPKSAIKPFSFSIRVPKSLVRTAKSKV